MKEYRAGRYPTSPKIKSRYPIQSYPSGLGHLGPKKSRLLPPLFDKTSTAGAVDAF